MSLGKQVTDAADVAAVVVAGGAMVDILPPLAAAFAIAWTCIRIYEWGRVVVLRKPPRGFDL